MSHVTQYPGIWPSPCGWAPATALLLTCILGNAGCTELASDRGGDAGDDVTGAAEGSDLPAGDGGHTSGGGGGGGTQGAGDGGIDAAMGDDHGGAEDGGDDSGLDGGDDADAASDAGTSSNVAPVVDITYPRTGTTQLAQLHVRGTVSDPDGDGVATVEIAGMEVPVSDGRWSALVPLPLGETVLQATAVDARGASGTSDSRTLTRPGPQPDEIHAFELEPDGSRALVLDYARTLLGQRRGCALLWVDLSSAAVTLASGGGRGSGPELTSCREMAYDPGGDRAFVIEDGTSIVRVNLTTGDREVIADADTPAQPGGGPVLMGASDLLYDDVADRVLIADPSADLLLAMDPDTGQRNTVSDTGDGAALLSGSRLAHDPGRGVVYVAGGGTIVVGRIDLGTGLRERIASQDDDRGRRTTAYYDIAYDAANDRALLRENDRLTQLELATLQRRQVAELPTADEYTSPTWGDMHFDPQTGELLVAGTDQLVRMPLTLADEVGYFSGPLSGSGPNFTSYGLAAYGGDIFAAAYWDDAIMRINPETGDREVFADSASSGVAFGDPVSLALDSSGSRLLAIADTSGGVPSLVAFNLETGSGTLLSGPETGDTDPAIVSGADLCIRVDGANDRALLANGDHVLAVDLSTAARAEFSGPSVGNGPLPTEFRDLAYDSWHDQYVAIGDGDQILAIDPTTGDRDVISSTADGSPGPALTDPESIAFLYGDQAVLVRDGSGELVHVALANGGRRESLRAGLYARDMAVFDGALLASMPSNDEIGRIELLSTESTQIGRWGMRALHLPPVMQDLASGAGYVVDPGNALTVLDLVAGRLSTVEGSGAAGDYRTDSFLNVSGGLAYVTTTPFFTSGSAALYQVDLATAESVVIASASVGSGTEPTSYNSGAFDGARGRALVFDANLGALISVNPDDGVRENVSGGPVGEGEPWDQPLQVLYDANGDRALVLDGAVVVSVDLQTGDRTALTGGGAGSGDPLMQPRAMALDLGGNRLIVRDTDTRSFVAVSLSDGARSPLVSDVEGIPAGAQGSLGPEPTRFDYDGARRVIFVAALTDRGPRGLLEVDELSGDWVLLDLQ